ncbi:electron transfer flavoprotein subunit beta/FixA family protein [Streptomyces sp. NPDC001530]|uniref:electron transfer flavoprotein subunit beta/FixA family protein n=1 Tax=Streptomyces sp. NPDC001530 TaxID=3364582 RepID=UPI003675CD5C
MSQADHTPDREDAELVLDEINERAAEEALRLKEMADAHVTVVSKGPDSTLDAIRKILAMGGDRGIRICDDRLRGADVLTTANVLAAAVRTVEDVDLVLAGNATTDGQASAVPAVVADLLALPQLTHVRKLDVDVDVDAGRVRAERETDDGQTTLDAPLPALVGVTE